MQLHFLGCVACVHVCIYVLLTVFVHLSTLWLTLYAWSKFHSVLLLPIFQQEKESLYVIEPGWGKHFLWRIALHFSLGSRESLVRYAVMAINRSLASVTFFFCFAVYKRKLPLLQAIATCDVFFFSCQLMLVRNIPARVKRRALVRSRALQVIGAWCAVFSYLGRS